MNLPSSPTLTNPDLILPGVDDYRFDVLSPQQQQQQQQQRHHDDQNDSYRGVSQWEGNWFGNKDYDPQHSTMRLEPTPIIYGNGTMLSDIGEVTEVESSPVKKKPFMPRLRKLDSYDRHIPAAIASPQLSYTAVAKRSKFGNHHRQVSVESTDTIRTIEEPRTVEFSNGEDDVVDEDDDDVVSVGDSNFQGDDEESVADSTYDHQLAFAQAAMAQRKEHVHEIMMGDNTSSGHLSRRAEAILANAKKRLDSMEGNLNRARNTQYITPSSSMNSIKNIGHHSTYRRSSPESGRDEAVRRPRQVSPHANNLLLSAAQPVSSNAQNNATTTEGDSSPSFQPITRSFRPTSAVGGPDFVLPRFGTPNTEQKEDNINRSSGKQTKRLSSGVTTPTTPRDSPRDGGNMYFPHQSPSYEPYLQQYGDHHGLTRSASSMQMRELTEKMKGLKGKISDLRDRAKEDALRRASMQSLRTPSPFTASKSWKESSPRSGGSSDESKESQSLWGQNSDSPRVDHITNGRRNVSAPLFQNRSAAASKHNISLPVLRGAQSMEDINSGHSNILNTSTNTNIIDDYGEDVQDDDGSEGYASESGASLYHDSVPTQVSHEDREDAFDYQHFFLHSAIGTVSQQRLNERRGSFSSEDSVETARAGTPTPPADIGTAPTHLRSQASDASISTLASFETANENFSPIKSAFHEMHDSQYFPNYEKEDAHETSNSNLPSEKERPVTPVQRSTPCKSPTQEQETVQSRTLQYQDLDEQEKNADIMTDRKDVNVGDAHDVAQSILQRQWTKEQSPERGTAAVPAQITSGNNSSALASSPAMTRHPIEHHRPTASISSFASSTGTTRSFPLVNKPKSIITQTDSRPGSSSSQTTTQSSSSPSSKLLFQRDRSSDNNSPFQSSPTSALRQEYYASSPNDKRTDSAADGMISTNHIRGIAHDPVSALLDEDRKLIKVLVASMGKCVLGLQKAGDSSVDGTMWRRRMELARKILDGEDNSR